jgi:hypothetical protein
MDSTISPALASVLRSGREEFNARFAAARRTYPELDAASFTEFLRGPVDKLVQAVERVRSDRVAEVVMAAYDAALQIAGQRFGGGTARQDFILQGWDRVLPGTAALVAEAPSQMCAAVSNALVNLAATPGARPEAWLNVMQQLAPRCDRVETFLKLGQVAAWRAGLAHFRSGALAQADTLPEELALTALGVTGAARWPETRRRLGESPWCDPDAPAGKPGLRVVARSGAFRGFGGLFAEPPLVAPAGEHFLVRSGDGCWLLTADAFGATFHRAPMQEFDAARKRPPLPPDVRLKGAQVSAHGARLNLEELGTITSAAANQTTFAATSAFTHAVVLIALR